VVRLKAYAESNSEPEAQIALDKAERDLVETQRKATIAADNLAAANKKMEETKKDIDKAAGTRMSEEIRANKTAYAEGIVAKNPISAVINLVAYGPSSGAAARKIRESLKDKSQKDKAYEAMKEAFEASEKEKNEGGAPAAVPVAAAPAGETAHAAAPTGG
jgi:hypothetical protein